MASQPLNPSQGRVEDAIASALSGGQHLALAELLDVLPRGWSRADLVGALTDGLLDGWIVSTSNDARVRYALMRWPPPIHADPLVAKFKAVRMQERLAVIEVELSTALGEAREFELTEDLLQTLVQARRCVRLGLARIDEYHRETSSPAATGNTAMTGDTQ